MWNLFVNSFSCAFFTLSLAGAAQILKTLISVFDSLVLHIHLHSFAKMKFVLGYWGEPLLSTGFAGFIALTFAGSTCVMIVCIDILTSYSEFNEPVMCFMFSYIAILLRHVFCIAFTNRAQHIFHFG